MYRNRLSKKNFSTLKGKEEEKPKVEAKPKVEEVKPQPVRQQPVRPQPVKPQPVKQQPVRAKPSNMLRPSKAKPVARRGLRMHANHIGSDNVKRIDYNIDEENAKIKVFMYDNLDNQDTGIVFDLYS